LASEIGVRAVIRAPADTLALRLARITALTPISDPNFRPRFPGEPTP